MRFLPGQALALLADLKRDHVAHHAGGRLHLADHGFYAKGRLDVLLRDHRVGVSKQTVALPGEQQRLARPLQCMGRVVRVEHAGHAGGRELRHGAQHQKLILEVEVGFRLIQNENARLRCQRAGDQNHLQLAPRHLGAAFALQMFDVQARHGLARSGKVCLARPRKKAHSAAAAEQHHFKGGAGRSRSLGLRHVGDSLPELPVGQRANVSAIQRAATGAPAQKTHDAAQQRGLPGAVGPQNGHHVAGTCREVDIL